MTHDPTNNDSMTNEEPQHKREAWVIDYLYGELDAEQKRIFEDSIKHDAQLRALYESQRALNDVLPKGSAPLIRDDRMQGVRWAAFRQLRKSPAPSVWQRLAHMWQGQVTVKMQVASMAFMFVAGVLVTGVLPANHNTADSVASDSALALVAPDDYNIVDVELEHYDIERGEVAFSFELASQSQVQGNLQDPHIRQLLTRSVHADSPDELRLNLTQLLGAYAGEHDVRQRLISTLLNDPNPGVRYHAVEHLVKLVHLDDVRQALRQALQGDVNNGVRVEAFLALSDNVDAELINVLREHSINDANTFIRERARRLLDAYGQQIEPENQLFEI